MRQLAKLLARLHPNKAATLTKPGVIGFQYCMKKETTITIRRRLKSLLQNGNRVANQRRGGANEVACGPTLLIQNLKPLPPAKNLQPLPIISTQNLPVVEANDRAPRRTQGDRDYKLTVDLPVFKGTQNMEEFFSWEYKVETGFGVMDCSEDWKFKVIANKLKESAAAHWK
ncbi:hypothetical protein LWI29_032323 [Acer saccharum]|uniref:Uncharacterized protein n=1 Tax=Acer saccharum TaxID=4024 RepID=A0AA39T6Y3_ACESA|nr:hypothetical protein LWI29_032323 [Acer saccharum]